MRSTGARVRIFSAWSALALVSWQGAAGVLETWAELRRWSIDKHLRALTASPDERIFTALRQDSEILRALRAHVPSDAHVLVAYSKDRYEPGLPRRVRRLRMSAYPMTFEGYPFDPRRPGVLGSEGKVWRGYVLELQSGRDYSSLPLCEELARGEGFRLLLVGSGAR